MWRTCLSVIAGEPLPVLHLVAARAAPGNDPGEREPAGPSVLPRPHRRAAGERRPAHGDAVPLGPARRSGAARGLAQPGHG